MEQPDILALLLEATELFTTIKTMSSGDVRLPETLSKIQEIHDKLQQGRNQGHEPQQADVDLAAALITEMYYDAGEKNPEGLRYMFPVFAALCGNRDGLLRFADVNWQICFDEVLKI